MTNYTLVQTKQGMRSVPVKGKEENKMVDDIIINALKTSIEVADKDIAEYELKITELQMSRTQLVNKIDELTNEVKK